MSEKCQLHIAVDDSVAGSGSVPSDLQQHAEIPLEQMPRKSVASLHENPFFLSLSTPDHGLLVGEWGSLQLQNNYLMARYAASYKFLINVAILQLAVTDGRIQGCLDDFYPKFPGRGWL